MRAVVRVWFVCFLSVKRSRMRQADLYLGSMPTLDDTTHANKTMPLHQKKNQ